MLTRRFLSLVSVLIAISLIAGCSVRKKSPDPTPTPDDIFVIVTATVPAEDEPPASTTRVTSYVVKEGDSLIEIAVRFDLTLEELREANEIEDANSIFVGQRLEIPTPVP